MKIFRLLFFVLAMLLTTNLFAQIPPGYYDSAQGLSGTQLKTALYDIIKGHTEYPYTSTATDTWDILKVADQDPNNPGNVIGIYSGFSMNAAAEYANGEGWTREHVWAQSRGGFGTSPGPGTDCHHLRAEDVSTNSAKSNRNFAESDTQYIDGDGQYSGATGSYSGPDYTWEPRAEMKGDVARMIFYMATRYEGENGEPDLELTETLLNVGDNSPLHGRLSDLLLWHVQDPVDAAEISRNNIIYSYQFNRNPFIDHPEYVTSIWGPPPTSVPYFTSASITSAAENVLYVYNITTEGGQGPRVLSAPTLPAWLGFSDSGNGSGTISGTPTILDVGQHNVVLEVTDGIDITTQNFVIDVIAASSGSDVVFINEIHYDNSGSDQDEGIELAGSAGKSLSGWSLHLYNGTNGTVYNTVNLSGIFTDQNNGFGFINFSIAGIQNGAPDGIALVNNVGEVVQFLSYEGELTASGGPANGMLSTDIGQSETSSTQVGFSLQLAGTGSDYADFTWADDAANTFGAVNNGQTFTGNVNQSPSVSVTSPTNGADFTTLDAINITADASDADGTVTQVEFFVNGSPVGTDTSAPYSFSWAIPDWGAYAIAAVATDDEGATTASSAVNITATQPNQDPSVSVTSPTNGADFTTLEAIDITANASDTDGTIIQVEFFVDGAPVGTDTTAPYSSSWVIPDWGAYVITAVATDDGGATTASSAVNITATEPPNQDPAVSVTSPTDGADFTTLDAIDITADASDTDGTVIQVEFFVDGTPVGTDTTAPYSFSWAIPDWGAYVITAVATDDDGATATSAAINITATEPLNQDPSVSVTSPTNGADFITLDAIDITADASDTDGAVTQVEFFVDGTPVGTDTTAPYSFSWAIPDWGAYVITAVATDNDGATTASSAVNITATEPLSETVFINEIHYDNDGSDQGEAIELAGNAGTDLTGWSLVLYNGNNGGVYGTTNLSGIFTDQANGYGFISFSIAGIQNGAPDGVALVDDSGTVVQFLSYEGAFTATDGPANGMLSTDIGQSETSTTQVGFSLQLAGTGSVYSDFTWADDAANTFGALNNGQSFGGVPPNQHPSVSVTSPTDGADFTTLDAINITADALDTDGTVTQVEFFVDGTPVGTDTTAPYSFSWVIPDWGAYVITAVATDDDGATTASSAVNITATDPGPPVGGGITMEHGTVSNVGSSWQTVNLQNTYTSMVVVATVHLPDGEVPAVSRIRNASGSSFEVRVQSPSGAILNGYAIQYLVVEEGVYTAGTDGVDMEAVRVTSTLTAGRNNWVFENRSYQNSYSSPVVIGQVMSENDADWSVFWASSSASRTSPPNASGFSAGKHVGEDPNSSRGNETLGYIVIEAGSGDINGIGYAAGLGADSVRGIGNSSSGYTYGISGLSSASEAMVSAAAMDGNDGGWPVLTTGAPVSANSIQVGFDEDQVSDTERKHTTEQVAYLVLGTSVSARSSGVTKAVTKTTDDINSVDSVNDIETRISSYPNPFTSELHLDITAAFIGEVKVEVYNQSGKLMYTGTYHKERPDVEISLDASHLNAGLYMVRAQMGDKIIVKKMIKR